MGRDARLTEAWRCPAAPAAPAAPVAPPGARCLPGCSFDLALDEGGVVWEGEATYPTVDDALRALDAALDA